VNIFIDYLYTNTKHGANIAPADMAQALPFIEAVNPRVIVEIGTYKGGSARMWQALFNPDVLITVDDTERAALGGCHYLPNVKSQDPATVASVVSILGDRAIDFLFIDGGHKYHEVKRDFDLYSRLVRNGGLVMLHDIANHGEDVGVPKFWAELKAMYDCVEITAAPDSSGLGLVFA